MRRFTIYKSPKAQRGEDCTYEKYLEIANAQWLLDLCKRIADTEDADKRGELKKGLPVITWQAAFDGRRVAKEAKPSGLFMLDIDHVDDPFALYREKVCKRIKELGIVYVGKTASCHGLRIVAKCRPNLNTIEECQRWLSSNLNVEFDGVCKDWARCSFLVHDSYTYFMNANEIWQEEPADGEVYSLDGAFKPNLEMEKALDEAASHEEFNNQTEGLFGGPKDYKGIPYERIAHEWMEYTGGEPVEGDRNNRVFKLATRMRYITDFNAATMLRVIPSYGLPNEEMKSIIRSAILQPRAADMPKDMQEVLDRIDKKIKLGEDAEEEIPEIITDTKVLPPMPPVIKQWVEVAPDDFKEAVALCQLPVLGALGSRLRSEYLDGKMHSPSFQVSLEAPQASGKSFLVMLANYELKAVLQHDEIARAKEREYQEKMRAIASTKAKVKPEDLPEKPNVIIRYVPATMSITMLLKRMEGAQGLHLFALAEEIDTVTRAFKRGFSNFSEALRVSFDNSMYGQDYASETSWSGNVELFYNCLFSGTPKAMRRFYPDVEDGLVSRVLFVTLPDQFGKPMPKWEAFSEGQKHIVDLGLERLNEISLVGDEVQPEHVMKMNWLNKAMAEWIKKQQLEAVDQNDRTRDVFCRRSAVVGFRAGMLAWFLWGEAPTPTVRRNVTKFAIWVANCMLNQHLLRFNIESVNSNTNRWENLLKQLPNEFTRAQLEEVARREGVDTSTRDILYKWKLNGCIEAIEKGRGVTNKKIEVKFKKLQK